MVDGARETETVEIVQLHQRLNLGIGQEMATYAILGVHCFSFSINSSLNQEY